MALAKDRATAYREGVELDYPVATGVKIYAGSMVCINAAGYAAPGADTVNFKFGGVALEQVDNTLGANGAKMVRARKIGVFEFNASSISQADLGKIMYLVDDETFDESDPGQGIVCGVLVKYISATKGWLDIASGVKPDLAAASADALTVSDAGNFFAAALGTVAAQIQDLAKGPFFLTVPHFTGWTKDGAAHAIAAPLVESPVPLKIKRAYVNLGTAPGAGKTLALTVNGGQALVSAVDAATQAEAEALDIAIAKDTDIIISANETAGGAGANADLILVLYKDDGE